MRERTPDVAPLASPSPLRVAMYLSPGGVAGDSFEATEALMRSSPDIAFRVVTPEDVRAGALDDQQVVIFTGGRGSTQGRYLGADGRARVRSLVERGMGYVGVCAGFYLALQGEPEFHKLAMVSGRHIGEAWIRGVTTIEAREPAGTVHRLFYANGPVIERVAVDGLDPYIELATFVSDVASPTHGTEPGVMRGSPAVIAATYGRGRLLLFSPNPVLSGDGEQPRTDLFLRAIRWAAAHGPVDPHLTLSSL